MTVKDLLTMEVDIDVYDNVCDDIGIAFCGPMKLTKSGQRKFASVLKLGVTLRNYNGDVVAIVDVDDPDNEEMERKLEKAKELFYSFAGYCSCEDYDKWFEEDE